MIDWDNEPDLGKVPDGVLAERLGVGYQNVYYQRHKRGLGALPRGVIECDGGCGATFIGGATAAKVRAGWARWWCRADDKTRVQKDFCPACKESRLAFKKPKAGEPRERR